MVETFFKIIMIGIFIAIVVGVVGTISFGWTLETSTYLSGLTNFLHVIYYVLPINKLQPIITVFLASMVFRIAIAIITALWRIIPIQA